MKVKRLIMVAGGIYLILVSTGLFPGVASSGESVSSQLFQLKAGGFGADSTSSWPVYIAQEKGFFAKEGLKLNITRSYEQMPALLGGSFDVIDEAADTPILAAARGGDVTVVYDISRRPSQFMVLAPGVNSVADLQGKIIGIWKIPSTDQFLLKKFLAKKGVDLNRVTFRKVGGSRDRFAALQAGQIGGTVLSTAYALRAQEGGMKLIASPADWEVFPWTLIIFKKRWAETNSDVVKRYLRGVYQGTVWLYDPANFEEAVRLLSPVTGFDEKTMRWSLQVSVENKVYNLQKPSGALMQLAADWLLSEGFLAKRFDAATVVDARYYEQAIK